MKILILHRIPYHKIDYHRGIDHDFHDVTYVGTETVLSNIPEHLNCQKLVRPGVGETADEVIALLEAQQLRFERILSLSEYELLDAAKVRDYFGVIGPTIAQVEKVRDKVLMKTMVAAAGIRVPEFRSLPKLMQQHPQWQDSIVLKPIDGASSENVKKFSSVTALIQALHQRSTGIHPLDQQNNTNFNQFEVEEFIQGPIIHFDGLVQKGDVKVVLASQYVGNCLEYANGQPLGSVQIDLSTQERFWINEVLGAVDLTQGSFHLEAIASEQGLVFLEVANRVGGADVVDTFELATGIHLPSVELKICIGETLQLPKLDSLAKKYGWYVFPGHHYQFDYCRISEDKRFRNHPFIVRWQQLTTTQKLPERITYQAVEVPLAGLVSGNNSEMLQAFLRELFSQVKVEPFSNPT
jgi:biotin carboxylase